jgi:hypothetical protein
MIGGKLFSDSRFGEKEICSMQYLLLIYLEESRWERLDDPEQQKIYQEYRDLIGDLQKAGKFLGGNELQPTSTATTVRVRAGKKSITDGPFAETKEQLGGYFLVEAKDLDEAMEIAARIPSATTGSIEVRPVVPRQAQ